MSPSISYRIWFTPRTGSTLLCKGLALTGVAGYPNEHFNFSADDTLLSMHNATTYPELRERIWSLGMGTNGVFGIKHSYYRNHYASMLKTLSETRNIDLPTQGEHEAFWADMFPNVKHIYLTRRNKVRQAVSWWQAIQTEQWHLRGEEKRKTLPENFWEERYDFAALSHLYKEAALRECATEAYFATHGIVPLTLVYEDMVRDFPGHLRKILGYLDLASENIVELNNSHFRRTATSGTEVWVERFRNDLQQGWENPAW